MFSLKGDRLYLLCASLALARNAARLRALRRYARFTRSPLKFLTSGMLRGATPSALKFNMTWIAT